MNRDWVMSGIFYLQNQEKFNQVAIESADGKCEKPVPLDNVIKNIYRPLSRPLFIYVNKKVFRNQSSSGKIRRILSRKFLEMGR